MPTFMQLPPYSVGNPLDTSPLTGAIDSFGNALKENRKRQQNIAIGNRLAAGDYSGGAALAFGAGELETGMGIRKFKSAEDAAADERQQKLIARMAGLAQDALDEKDPARQADKFKKFMAIQGVTNALPEAYRADPRTALGYVVSSARGYQDSLERRLKLAQAAASETAESLNQEKLKELRQPTIGYERRATMAERYGLARGSREYNEFVLTGDFPRAMAEKPGILADVEQRKLVAAQLGLHEGTPAYQSYVATGKLGRDEPMTATDRKAVMDADQNIANYDFAIKQMQRALDINDKALAGAGAGTWSSVQNAVGMGSQRTLATAELENILSRQAIEDMAKTLKGASTDKEMFKFIELAGDPSTPRELRRRYLTAAITKLNMYRAVEERQSNEIRGGTYYKPRTADDTVPRGTGKPTANDPLGIR